MTTRRVSIPPLLLILGAVSICFFSLPFVGLLTQAPWTDLPSLLGSSQALAAVRLSLICSLLSTIVAVVFGLPLAWILARTEFRAKWIVRGVVLLPLVLPPVVGGVALILALGRAGLIGGWLESVFGVTLFGTTAGVVVAETFVSMPFLVLAVEAGLRSMNRRYEEAARTLGASPTFVFRRVTLPLVVPSLIAGAVLAWARALGEFGATIAFAGNLPDSTQTVPLAVFVELQRDVEGAVALSLVLVAVSIAILAVLRDRWMVAP
ncbi:MAG: ABC transporter permease [Actinomycetota bacterium]|nr:ABC transporter permease [Actinomycetota bacterium]